MSKVLYTEDEMERELVKRGHNIYTDSDNCLDSTEIVEIAVSIYGFGSKLNDEEELEFIGSFK